MRQQVLWHCQVSQRQHLVQLLAKFAVYACETASHKIEEIELQISANSNHLLPSVSYSVCICSSHDWWSSLCLWPAVLNSNISTLCVRYSILYTHIVFYVALLLIRLPPERSQNAVSCSECMRFFTSICGEHRYVFIPPSYVRTTILQQLFLPQVYPF